MVDRRLAGFVGGDDWALKVVVALEVLGEVRSVDLRGETAACEGRGCCFRGVVVVERDEARATLAAALVGSGAGKGSEVR